MNNILKSEKVYILLRKLNDFYIPLRFYSSLENCEISCVFPKASLPSTRFFKIIILFYFFIIV